MKKLLYLILITYGLHFKECFSKFEYPKNDILSSTNLPTGWDPNIQYIRSFPETEQALALHETKNIIIHYKKIGLQQPPNVVITASDVAKQWPILYIAYVSESIGMGCFTSKSIKKGTFIREYTGTIMPTIQPLGFNSDYAAHLTEEILIDATECGNESRYMNDSENPNTERIILILPNKNITSVIRAIRDIKTHEQITWHYGNNYWNIRKTQPDANQEKQ